MENENVENLNSINEETDQTDNLEITEDDIKPDAVESKDDDSEEVKVLKEKNKSLFARAKKAEGFVVKDGVWVKKQKPAEITKPETKVSTETTNPLELVKLAKAFSDYDADEIEFVTNHAKSSKPEDLFKSANDEWVKRAIKARREEIEKEKKIPGSSSPSSTVGIKSPQEAVKFATDKKITDEKIDDITRKAFEESKKTGGKSGA